jgi:hypothetical protein
VFTLVTDMQDMHTANKSCHALHDNRDGVLQGEHAYRAGNLASIQTATEQNIIQHVKMATPWIGLYHEVANANSLDCTNGFIWTDGKRWIWFWFHLHIILSYFNDENILNNISVSANIPHVSAGAQPDFEVWKLSERKQASCASNTAALGGRCAYVTSGGRWERSPCQARKSFICEHCMSVDTERG